jgi:hypothetical protein
LVPNKHFIPKNLIENWELAARIEIIQINKQRKEDGLTYLSQEEQAKVIQKHKTQETQAKEDLSKKYGVSNEALTSLLAMFSTKRQEAIAKASQKDTQIVLQFKKKEPPKLGQKPVDNSDRFTELTLHYNKVPWDIWEEIQRLQGEVADLTKIKQMTMNQMDENGTRVKEPVLPKNNQNITGLTDPEFSRLNRTIQEKQIKLYQVAGLWMYGIPEDQTPNCETLTLSLAVEAGLYRLQFGFPSENPNSDYYVR